MYSMDFKEAALNYRHNGHTCRETCRAFGICLDTLNSWLHQEKEGRLEPKAPGGRKPLIPPEALKGFMDSHPDAYQREVAEAFGCSQPCICRSLARIGYTFKKNRSATKSRMSVR